MKTQKKITEKAKEPVYKHNIGSTTDFKVEAKLLVYAEEGTDEWKRQTNRFKAVEEKDKVRLYHTGPGEVIEMKSEVKSIIEKQKELIYQLSKQPNAIGKEWRERVERLESELAALTSKQELIKTTINPSNLYPEPTTLGAKEESRKLSPKCTSCRWLKTDIRHCVWCIYNSNKTDAKDRKDNYEQNLNIRQYEKR